MSYKQYLSDTDIKYKVFLNGLIHTLSHHTFLVLSLFLLGYLLGVLFKCIGHISRHIRRYLKFINYLFVYLV